MARGGRGTAAPSEERAAEKEARLDFAVSSGPASNAGLAGTVVAWCGRGLWWGQAAPRPLAHPYLQALQRKTNDSLNVVDSPGLSPGPARGAGGPG